MGNYYRSICDFGQEITELLNSPELHKKFRYNTLLLLKKHFSLNHSSFVLHDNKYKENKMKLYMDNVTLGLSPKMIHEYYDYYQKLNPFVYTKFKTDVVDLFEIIPEEEFLKTKYYKDFYSNYKIYYQVVMRIQDCGATIAHISLGRTKEEGPFNKQDINNLIRIRKIIETELLKALRFRELSLEVSVLREHANIFPKGHIVMDKNYNVSYFNDISVPYVEELTGSDISFFKYYFVNEIINNDGEFDRVNHKVIEDKNFLIKVTNYHHDLRSESSRNEINYVVYITKRDISEEIESNLANNYFDLLTPREREVSHLIRRGYSNKEIGESLKISPFTVKTHIQRIYAKCNSKNRIELINNIFKE